MRNFKIDILILLLFITTSSCKKSGSEGADNKVAPTDLQLSANISSDGSGSVAFKATATNAVTYDYEFGNGVVQTGTNGTVTYQYNQSGTYKVGVTAISNSGLTLKKTADIQITVQAGSGNSLAWSDEFNADGAPDATKWGYDIGTGDNGWGNAESQYYTNRSQNVNIEGGILKIKAQKENYSGSTYTSARMLSKGKFDFKYGRVEVRAKMPAGVGTWPAIWMLGSNIDAVGWPACGEIDIAEHLGRDLNKIYATLHYPGRFGGSANGATRTIANATTEFHIYGLEWSASVIKMTVDGQTVHTVNNSSSIPFNQNFFFILNVAMGGNFGGTLDPAITSAIMEVDYIRVYK
ncbi:family 16 glycosylhydrolase [Pedobacter alpinus]|uniref:Family 16 glycosylhydrolase n=1 Tax=Pedobacter alpinus TaxID=1590643 RepID=A0ABW5TTH3_9SPHI